MSQQNPQKKILLVTRPLTPPWDEASKIFAFYLAKSVKNFAFTVLTHGIVDEIPSFVTQLPIYTSHEMDMPIMQRANILKLFPKRKNFNIVHFMMTPSKLNSFGFKMLLRGSNAKTVQTVATLREDLLSDDDFKKILFADLVITYSEYAENKLREIGLENVQRIYPGIDTDKYYPTSKNLSTMKLFGIKETEFVISYPGEFVRLGATDDLVSMLPVLFEKIPNAKFVFACRIKNEMDARKKSEVIETLRQQGILEKVVFTDTFSDMPKIYNMSDVILFPVRNMEGKFDVPLVVIEAFACEKPVIISDLPILQEFSSNENAIIVPTGNSKCLIESIIELFNNKVKCDIIGMAARQYAIENFDIRDVANQYEEAYNKLLKA